MNPLDMLTTRMVVYVMSTIIGLIPAQFAGNVHFDTTSLLLTVDLRGLITAALSGMVLSFGVLKKWGIKS